MVLFVLKALSSISQGFRSLPACLSILVCLSYYWSYSRCLITVLAKVLVILKTSFELNPKTVELVQLYEREKLAHAF